MYQYTDNPTQEPERERRDRNRSTREPAALHRKDVGQNLRKQILVNARTTPVVTLKGPRRRHLGCQ